MHGHGGDGTAGGADGAGAAIVARNVHRSYGKRSSKVKVLQGLNLTIPRGSIYGLLGPSGCGKTTLLKCLVGRLTIDEGHLTVLGKEPNTQGHAVPGSLVGYMPQEIALYPSFTVWETLRFCARLHNLKTYEFEPRATFLLSLLDIIDLKDRYISNLSGGQKRRVSFTAALLHSPPLVILDEPTVGVDPILRARLWQHLTELTNGPSPTTVLITTHYIEEARQAMYVGMMRGGRLLAEAEPEHLIHRLHMSSLEDTFLALCHTHSIGANTHDDLCTLDRVAGDWRSRGSSSSSSGGDGQREDEQSTVVAVAEEEEEEGEEEIGEQQQQQQRRRSFRFDRRSKTAGHADTRAHGTQGRPHAAHVNDTGSLNATGQEIDEAAPLLASSRHHHHHQQQQQQQQQRSRKGEGAVERYGAGRARPNRAKRTKKTQSSRRRWGPGLPTWRNFYALLVKNMLRLGRNYGLLVFQFMLPALQIILYCLAIGRDPTGLRMAVVNDDVGVNVSLPTAHTLRFSDIYLHQLSNKTIHQVPVATYEEAVHRIHRGDCWGVYQFAGNYSQDIIKRLSKDDSPAVIAGSQISLTLDNSNQQISIAIEAATAAAFESMVDAVLGNLSTLAASPVRFEKPIYGELHPTFTDFVAPGIMVSITFAQAIGLTAMSFVLDRKEGLLDRVWVAGARASDVILAHMATQFWILAGQTAAVLFFALVVFKLPIVGSLAWVIVLMMMLGLSGMAYGLFISTQVDSEVGAIQVAMGSFFPVLLLSGVLWPLQAIPQWLLYISYIMPTTWAAEAMRSLMLRGWTILHQDVWLGFVVVLAWTLLLLFFAAVGIRSVD
ncbi:hypothetical protein PTSG_08882 [Salpingoeca rosetta]|uniref:Uncharacterized protein n=1 Tax=Salpingoeca rosetta (strain ATCC 50818 / BSB-021) TaxID=946362 RepID=F2UKZ3_SALR5|nr:uncharacterized protein PTSG_08882 [Salpingoeca rosetta]EGD77792.1 hypothetical protein PTSG_08882 [Salpingoeca rosetta]|eukprot:XP_004990268.1 hypothetical protein PTSG_08882 [Salpingoeca rosetta]